MTPTPALLLGLLLAAPAEPIRADAIGPRAAALYANDDPAAPLKRRIEGLMGLYLVDPPRRHDAERVSLEGRKATLRFWQPPTAFDDTELMTRAVQWFFFGRTQYASGVRGVFSELPEIDEVTLVFIDVQRAERKTRRRGEESIVPYLVLRLTRRHFENIDPEPLARCVEKADCTTAFRATFDDGRLDRRGLKIR